MGTQLDELPIRLKVLLNMHAADLSTALFMKVLGI